MRNVVAIVAGIVVLCAVGQARSAPDASLKWADRLLKRAGAFPKCSYQYDSGPLQAAEAYRHITTKYGPDSRACLGLARSQMMEGEYSQAVASFRQALALSAKRNVVLRELRAAERSAHVAADASRLLGGRTIVQVANYPVAGGTDLWLVLSSNVVYDNERQIDSNHDVRLTLIQAGGRQLRLLWQCMPLGPGYTEGQFDQIQLYVLDLTGDGVPAALVTETQIAAWWQPSHLDIFRRQGQGMTHVLGVSSQEPLSIEDLDGDGRYEVRNYSFIGTTMIHDDQPIWFDVYAYRNGSYQIANWQFPRTYSELAGQIRKQMSLHPRDRELLEYRGRVPRLRQRLAKGSKYGGL